MFLKNESTVFSMSVYSLVEKALVVGSTDMNSGSRCFTCESACLHFPLCKAEQCLHLNLTLRDTKLIKIIKCPVVLQVFFFFLMYICKL